MTRDELVTFICTSTGYGEPDDIAACQTFLVARDRMIYDSALWKDSLVMCEIAVDPVNNADHAEGIVFLPEVIARAVAVRTAENAVRVTDLGQYFRIDLDQFARTGQPFEFSILNPAWFVWRGTQALQLVTAVGDTAPIKIVWRDELGKRFSRSLLNGALLAANAVVGAVKNGVLVSGAGEAEANGFLLKQAATYAGRPLYLGGTASYLGAGVFAGAGPQLHWDPDFNLWSLGAVFGGPGFGDAYTSADNVATPDLVTTWAYASDPTHPPLPTVIATYPGRLEIEAMFKPATTADVSLDPSLTGDIAGGTLATTDTRSPSYQRLRLFGMPTVATTLRVLGKAQYEALDFATQEPGLRNSENALIAFTRGDLLRRGGENGAAGQAFQEGTVLLQQLKDLEAVQAASNSRIIPDSGYGPDQAMHSMGGLLY
jgi:hypothetical protein